MADENDKVDTSELDGIDDNEAEQLLADAVNADGNAGEKDTDGGSEPAKDWAAEAKKWRDLSRKNEKSFKDTAAKLKKYEDEGKSELQRLQEERDQLRESSAKSASETRAMRVAMDRAPEHATLAQVRAVAKRVRGDDDDEIEQDADELFALLAPESKAAPKTPSRPKERLKGGSEPDEAPEETDPRKLAALVPRRR
jgi:hypothetical protein